MDFPFRDPYTRIALTAQWPCAAQGEHHRGGTRMAAHLCPFTLRRLLRARLRGPTTTSTREPTKSMTRKMTLSTASTASIGPLVSVAHARHAGIPPTITSDGARTSVAVKAYVTSPASEPAATSLHPNADRSAVTEMRRAVVSLRSVTGANPTEPFAVVKNTPIFSSRLTSTLPSLSRWASIRAMSVFNVATCSSQVAPSSAADSKRRRLYRRTLPRGPTSPRLNESDDSEAPNSLIRSSSVSESDMTSSETSKRFIASAPQPHGCDCERSRRLRQQLGRDTAIRGGDRAVSPPPIHP